MLESCASTWFDQATAKGIELEFEPEHGVVYGTEWLLIELLNNLIDNAIRYTPSGGNILVRSGMDAQGAPCLEVEDSGPGIPQEEQQKIFDRFYRIDGTTEVGTGLGLAIVKEVAERHYARIAIGRSRFASGSVFKVSFPGGQKMSAQPGKVGTTN
jgi:two-component system sensor histidine kinase TctE